MDLGHWLSVLLTKNSSSYTAACIKTWESNFLPNKTQIPRVWHTHPKTKIHYLLWERTDLVIESAKYVGPCPSLKENQKFSLKSFLKIHLFFFFTVFFFYSYIYIYICSQCLLLFQHSILEWCSCVVVYSVVQVKGLVN